MTDTPTPERGASVEIEPQSSFLRPQDFSEDFSHENGNYQCRCYRCGHTFVGHKRRVTCKLCVTIDALTYERDALRAECARLNEIAEGWRVKAERYARERNNALMEVAPLRGQLTAATLNPGAPRDGE